MTSKIKIDQRCFDLKNIIDRSIVFQIIKQKAKEKSKINIEGVTYDFKYDYDKKEMYRIFKAKLKGCDQDYLVIEGGFKLCHLSS